ncbi:MAG: DUF2887 domain-containing protein [Nostocales cyanobacterium ELA583]
MAFLLKPNLSLLLTFQEYYYHVHEWGQHHFLVHNSKVHQQNHGGNQQELINSGRIKRIYLDELPPGSIGMGLIELIVSKEAQAPELVKTLLDRTKTEVENDREKQGIIELLETVLLSKFSQLSRQEIEAMFLVSDIKQTRVYQEAKQEGREEGREEGRQNGEMILLIRQLSKRFGKLKDIYIENINSLNIEQLEKLGEALLDFVDINDLETWLKSEIDK